MAESEPVSEIEDVSMIDRVVRRRCTISKDGVIDEEEVVDTLPEDLVAKLSELLGDGKARVTVGAELASSVDYGNKAQAFVSISVACDSAEDNINEAHNIIYMMAKKLVVKDHHSMSKVRDAMVTPGQELGDRCPTNKKEDDTARPRKSGGSAPDYSRGR